MQRRSSTIHRGDLVGDNVGETTQRVAAALRTRRSCAGRASIPIVRPDSAASCKRRDPAMSSPLPSAITARTAEQRSATSMHQNREWESGGSTQMLRGRTSPSRVGLGQHARPIQTMGPPGSEPDGRSLARMSARAVCASAATGADGYIADALGVGSGSNHSCTPPGQTSGRDESVPRSFHPRSTERPGLSGASLRSSAEIACTRACIWAELPRQWPRENIRSDSELMFRVYIQTHAVQAICSQIGRIICNSLSRMDLDAENY